ncbi:hypothetical protein J4Q44_G00361450 [Coregonus suidteri]|uniref:Uncharacterized protein n=1 Tax=Coregonus suidteri TaxID=861788 RepID=A0AAN8KQW1_9TELE
MSGLKMENTDCNPSSNNQQPSASPTAEPVQTDNTSQGAEGNMEDVHQRSIDVKVLLIPWGMLVVVTAGVLVAWKMWRKHSPSTIMPQPGSSGMEPVFGEAYGTNGLSVTLEPFTISPTGESTESDNVVS